MTQYESLTPQQINDSAREGIAEYIQVLTNLVEPGSLVTGWVVVFSVASDKSVNRGAFGMESAIGQGLHVDLGLLQMGSTLTQRRALPQ